MVLFVIMKLRDRLLISAQHNTKWWFSEPDNSSAIRNCEETFKTGENMGGAVQLSVAQKFD